MLLESNAESYLTILQVGRRNELGIEKGKNVRYPVILVESIANDTTFAAA